MTRSNQVLRLVLLIGLAGPGCTIAPKSFHAIRDAAPFTRARAVDLAGQAPPEQAIPALIQKLEDPDSVVRLAAHEKLKQISGKDFGYEPWADDASRQAAISRWKSWWGQSDHGVQRVATQRDRRRPFKGGPR